MAEAALDFLNGEDLPSLPVAAQADYLTTWDFGSFLRAEGRILLHEVDDQ
jgi:hypothetical protein